MYVHSTCSNKCTLLSSCGLNTVMWVVLVRQVELHIFVYSLKFTHFATNDSQKCIILDGAFSVGIVWSRVHKSISWVLYARIKGAMRTRLMRELCKFSLHVPVGCTYIVEHKIFVYCTTHAVKYLFCMEHVRRSECDVLAITDNVG